MAVTIAVLTAAYCLTLAAFADAIAARAHKPLAKWLERLAGIFLVGFE